MSGDESWLVNVRTRAFFGAFWWLDEFASFANIRGCSRMSAGPNTTSLAENTSAGLRASASMLSCLFWPSSMAHRSRASCSCPVSNTLATRQEHVSNTRSCTARVPRAAAR